ncbi:DMT family transporter [Thermococcus pacificus]|uniref:Permease n=1 Tax=Thermococcus pacificus TaxID=71998 RepID=A0A218P8S9_9EURY|nr:DMT family transporter [Thermococcus pacificus]ASJ07176.1 permease [Thermococcus pacificus]
MRGESLGTLLALFGMLLYGFEPVVIKANPSNPVSFAAFSALFASLLLWMVLVFEGSGKELWDNPSGIKMAFLVGLFGTALAYLAYSFGARMSTAINAALITRSEVLWSFLLAGIFLGEKITRRLVAYSSLILAGLVLVITQGRAVEPHLGDVLLLLVPLFWQAGHVIAKRLPYRPITIATLRNTFGSLLLLPLALLTGLEFSPLVVAEGVIIALGQVVWYGSIKRINLSKATAIITPAPAVAIGIGILTGETLTAYHLLGFVLISIGTLGAVKVESELRT